MRADPTTKQLIERWENVIRVLRALSPHERKKHFDMGTFGVHTDCGTVACAAGHCSLDPWFRRRGFRAEMNSKRDSLELVNPEPETDGRNEWASTCMKFFGDGAKGIFFDWQVVLPRERHTVGYVIREIRRHIKKLKGKSPSANTDQNK